MDASRSSRVPRAFLAFAFASPVRSFVRSFVRSVARARVMTRARARGGDGRGRGPPSATSAASAVMRSDASGPPSDDLDRERANEGGDDDRRHRSRPHPRRASSSRADEAAASRLELKRGGTSAGEGGVEMTEEEAEKRKIVKERERLRSVRRRKMQTAEQRERERLRSQKRRDAMSREEKRAMADKKIQKRAEERRAKDIIHETLHAARVLSLSLRAEK